MKNIDLENVSIRLNEVQKFIHTIYLQRGINNKN